MIYDLLSEKGFIRRARLSNDNASVLCAKKKVPDEEEREKKSPLELMVVYMTPWRNPNSIFVYMFAILYALGKVSEARHLESLQ